MKNKGFRKAKYGAALAACLFASVCMDTALAQDVAYSNILHITVSGGPYSDETVVRFAPAATYDFDGDWDAYKLWNGGNTPDIYTSLNGTVYAINSFPGDFEDFILPLNLKAAFTGDYVISATGLDETFDSSYAVVLEDRTLQVNEDLWASREYAFSAVQGDNSGRFYLHFTRKMIPAPATDNISVSDSGSTGADTLAVTGTTSPADNSGTTDLSSDTTAVAANNVPDTSVVSGQSTGSVTGVGTEVSNMNPDSSAVAAENIDNGGSVNNDPDNPAAASSKMDFNVYPVPSEGSLHVGNFTKTAKDKTIRILNSAGKVLYEKVVDSNDESAVLDIDLSADKGILTVQEISNHITVVKRVIIM